MLGVEQAGRTACLKAIALGGPGGETRFVVGEGGVLLRGDVSRGPLRTVKDDGFPNYYYGAAVAHVAQQEWLVVTGFVDGASDTNTGVALISGDGGATWTQRTVVSNSTWLGGPIGVLYSKADGNRVDAADSAAAAGVRLVVPSATAVPVFSAPLQADGTAGPWVSADAGSGWHAGPMVIGADEIVLTGVQMCQSVDGARSFACAAAADATFDGGVAAQSSNTSNWLTGGGTIAPEVAGWVHHSSDSGRSWQPRSLETAYPIRWVGFGCGPIGATVALAAGGDYFTGVGGIWSSTDAGATWKLEVDTKAEMSACAAGLGFVTCVGASKKAQSVVVTARC